MPGIGDNVKAELKSVIERIERLEEQKKLVANDIKEVYAEAKASGFDTKILRKVIAARKKTVIERAEEAAMAVLETCRAAVERDGF